MHASCQVNLKNRPSRKERSAHQSKASFPETPGSSLTSSTFLVDGLPPHVARPDPGPIAPPPSPRPDLAPHAPSPAKATTNSLTVAAAANAAANATGVTLDSGPNLGVIADGGVPCNALHAATVRVALSLYIYRARVFMCVCVCVCVMRSMRRCVWLRRAIDACTFHAFACACHTFRPLWICCVSTRGWVKSWPGPVHTFQMLACTRVGMRA